MTTTSLTAQDVLKTILAGPETQRETTLNAVVAGALTDEERAKLRSALVETTRDKYPPALEKDGNETVSWTRTWLFSMLAIVSDNNAEARTYLLAHLREDTEPNEWVSYWLLYGLIRGKTSWLKEAAATAAAHSKPLVSMLAKAVTAQEPTATQARRDLQTALESTDWDQMWPVMRALRWVVLQNNHPEILRALCKIVDHASEKIDDFERNAYDAIIALGNIEPKTDSARQAADVLDRFVFRARRHSQRVPERRKALAALGALQIEKVDLLLDELTIDDPTMARDAALALEKMLGTRRATARIFEKAQENATRRTIYADALRWMENQELVIAALDGFWSSGDSSAEEVARDLISKVGGAIAFERLRFKSDTMDKFTELMQQTQTSVNNQFNETIAASRQGFRIQTWMDRIVFAVGLFFIILTGLLAVTGDTTSSWVGIGVTGGLGVFGILYNALIARPRENIKDAAFDQSELQMIFLGYLSDLNRIDQAYIEQILEDKPLTADQVQGFINITSELRKQGTSEMRQLRLQSQKKAEA